MSQPNPRRYLTNLRRPYVTLADCARAMGVKYQALYARVRNLPPEETPESNGAFRAGAITTFVLETGIDWCERHLAYWRREKEGVKS